MIVLESLPRRSGEFAEARQITHTPANCRIAGDHRAGFHRSTSDGECSDCYAKSQGYARKDHTSRSDYDVFLENDRRTGSAGQFGWDDPAGQGSASIVITMTVHRNARRKSAEVGQPDTAISGGQVARGADVNVRPDVQEFYSTRQYGKGVDAHVVAYPNCSRVEERGPAIDPRKRSYCCKTDLVNLVGGEVRSHRGETRRRLQSKLRMASINQASVPLR
jgi:hypothetical protein